MKRESEIPDKVALTPAPVLCQQ